MNEALLFLHLVGLMLGAAGGFASAVIMRRALVLPADEAKVVRGLGKGAFGQVFMVKDTQESTGRPTQTSSTR